METGNKLLVESSTTANTTIAFQHLSYAQKLQAYMDSPYIHWTYNHKKLPKLQRKHNDFNEIFNLASGFSLKDLFWLVDWWYTGEKHKEDTTSTSATFFFKFLKSLPKNPQPNLDNTTTVDKTFPFPPGNKAGCWVDGESAQIEKVCLCLLCVALVRGQTLSRKHIWIGPIAMPGTESKLSQ